MDHSEPSSGIAMSVPGHDECTALQTTHTWCSNPSSQNDYTKDNEDDFLGHLGLQIPSPLFDFPEVASFSPANDSFERELPAFKRYHAEQVPRQSFSDKETSNYGFASKDPQQQRLPQAKRTCVAGLNSCNTVALSTLRKLHIHRTAGLCIFQTSSGPAVGSEPSMLDEILRINTEAMQSISRMLECTCLERFSLCLMTCIICKKLVSVNWKTILSEKQGGSSKASNRNCTESMPGLNLAVENWRQEQTSRAAVRVGDFEVDSEIAGRFRLCVLLEDVERLRTLMERLSGRSTDENLTAILHGLRGRLDKCPPGANIMLNS